MTSRHVPYSPNATRPCRRKNKFRAFCLYACATEHFIRFYVVSDQFYLDMPRYLSGHERLSFQKRILPIYLMWPINHSPFLMHHLSHTKGGFDAPSAATPETLAFYILSLVSFSLASFFVYRLYCAVTPTRLLASIVLPLFMVLTLWTYVVHIDANFSFPHDMPSVAFFAAGLLAIYTRRFWPLVLIMFCGTLNRETTLFLVGIYAMDAASPDTSGAHGLALPAQIAHHSTKSPNPEWPSLRHMAGRKMTIHHHFQHNDNSETSCASEAILDGSHPASGLPF